MLLEEEERQRVKGIVVNKFRGDKRLFDSGCDILREKGGVPVAGVIPYIHCDIDDEDSLSEKSKTRKRGLSTLPLYVCPGYPISRTLMCSASTRAFR